MYDCLFAKAAELATTEFLMYSNSDMLYFEVTTSSPPSFSVLSFLPLSFFLIFFLLSSFFSVSSSLFPSSLLPSLTHI